MHGIYTYIPETSCVPREYSVAAILLLLFMVLISLVSVLNLLYFHISTFRSMCAVPNVAVFCSSIIISSTIITKAVFGREANRVQVSSSSIKLAGLWTPHTKVPCFVPYYTNSYGRTGSERDTLANILKFYLFTIWCTSELSWKHNIKIYIRIYVKIYIRIYIKIYIRIYIKIYIIIYIKIYIKIYIRIYIKIYIRIYIKIYNRIYIKIYIRIYIKFTLEFTLKFTLEFTLKFILWFTLKFTWKFTLEFTLEFTLK